MTKIQYRVVVKRNEFNYSVSAGSTEEEAHEVFSLFRERFPESRDFSVEVFKIETIEKKLITENWRV